MLHNTAAAGSRAHARLSGVRVLLVIIVSFLTCVANAATAQRPVLSAAVIQGVSVYTPTELFATYRDRLGQPITRQSAQAIVGALADLYVHDGYARPAFSVDDALLSSGILKVQVSEPRITRVTFDGSSGPYAHRLETLAATIATDQPVRRQNVQSVVERMRELPGLTVNVATRRDTTAETGYELVFNTAFETLEGVVQATNRGTDEIGPHFMLGQLVANGLLHQGEKVGLLFSAAAQYEEYHGLGGFLDVPVGGRGTRAMLMGFRSYSTPHETPDLPDEFQRDKLTLRFSQPLRLASGPSLSVSAALDANDLVIDRDGLVFREDRVRVAEIGARASWRSGEAMQYLATLDVRQGIKGLGSELHADDIVNDKRRLDFLLARVALTGVRRLNEVWSLRVDALAQQTGYVLPYDERFKIGGDRLGRGFEVAEIAGDTGVGAKLELRRELPWNGDFIGKSSVYGFYDHGATWKQDVQGTESAGTAGTGFALRGGRVSGYVEVAMPVGHADVEGKTGAAVFAEVGYRF